MNRFYIYFWGLICHIGKDKNDPDEKTHAALVHTHGPGQPATHIPKLVFSNGAESKLGGNVTFVGGHSNATFSAEFTQFVASLKQLIGQNTDAKPSVYATDPAEAYHFHYPKGDVHLSVANLYERFGIDFVDGVPQTPRHVARVVVATVDTNAAELKLRFKNSSGVWETDKKLTLEDPCLLVANAEIRRDTLNDARFYKRLLESPLDLAIEDGARHDDQVEFPGCSWVWEYVKDARRAGLRAATSTECGNSAWP